MYRLCKSVTSLYKTNKVPWLEKLAITFFPTTRWPEEDRRKAIKVYLTYLVFSYTLSPPWLSVGQNMDLWDCLAEL